MRCHVQVALVLTVSFAGFVAVPDVSGQRNQEPPVNPSRDGVAIIPFTNITGELRDRWIGAGIAETLVTDLQDRRVVVGLDRVTDTMTAVGLTATVQTEDGTALEVARRLGARWVISGGYQRFGTQIRITGRRVDVQTGVVVSSAKIDGALDDLFRLQDRIATELVDAAPAVAEPPERSVAQPPAPVSSEGAAPPSLVSPAIELPSISRPVEPPATASPADEPTGGAREPGAVAEVPSTTNSGGFAVVNMIDGPAPPLAPEVVARDERGRATVRAIKLSEGIRLDGRLDERVYQTVSPIAGFVQQLPVEGAPATEPTEAWIMFDGANIYVAARCYDSAPPSEWVANEMRRDTNGLRQNDTFGVMFDTFYDRRNGVMFYTNPLGALADFGITNEGNPNSDWNPVWDVRTGRFDGGWTVEMEIPFQSLRYRPGPSQLWGVQLRRVVRRKNEASYLTHIPISVGNSVTSGSFRVSAAGSIVGIEAPPGSRNFELKPYAIGGVTTDLATSPPTNNEGDGDLGLDAKYGITQNLTADLTYNTDFAQVEVDEQQVNLTGFSLFFPEKREFFLEGRGIFDFARGGSGGGVGLNIAGGGGGGRGGGNTPTIFFSRRIGLQGGEVIPILGGGRVTGKVGAFDVGALNIQTDDEVVSGADSTNFTVLRVKRDILRRSSVGGIFTNRSVSIAGDGSNQAYGADATFAFYDNVSLLGYFAKTQTPGISGRDISYQGRFDYAGDRYGLNLDHLVVEDDFIPEVGFLRRDNLRRTFASGRFSPRPRSIERVRKFTIAGSLEYILTANEGLLETRQGQVRFETEFENSDRFQVSLRDNHELLTNSFEISPGVILPVGGYDFTNAEVSYSFGAQRRASGTVLFSAGRFWSGDIRTVEFTRGRVEVIPELSIEPSVSLNWVDLPEGSFSTELIRARVSYTFNPRMFFSALLQYNSSNDIVGTNLRLRWEYMPGSELFVVYTEDRDANPLMPDRYTELRNRGFVVKVNRLFRF